MKVLVTGANGFLATHLLRALSEMTDVSVVTYTRSDGLNSLYIKLAEADFIFHLAGVNRPKDRNDFLASNVQLTSNIVDYLITNNIKSPIYFSSSIHTVSLTEYGVSKLAGEVLMLELQKINGNKVIIERLTRVFGPGAKPDYNSVVATFCCNVIKNIPLEVIDKNELISMMYVGDLIPFMVKGIRDLSAFGNPKIYTTSVGDLAKLITNLNNKESIPISVDKDFLKKLYETYLSYKTFLKNS